MFQVGLGDGFVFGHSNNTLSEDYSEGKRTGLSYVSLDGLNNGPLSLHCTRGALLLWQK